MWTLIIIIIIIVVVVAVDDDTYYWVYLSSDHLFQVYYKVRQVLLQSVIILLQSATAFLLQSATGFTKCDNFITKCGMYYKVRQNNRQLYKTHGQYEMFLLFYFCLFNFLVFTARRFWVCFTWNHRWLFAVWTGRYTWYRIFVLHFFFRVVSSPRLGRRIMQQPLLGILLRSCRSRL